MMALPGQKTNSSSSLKAHQAANPFARALAESEKLSQDSFKDDFKDSNPFGQALARTGSSFPDAHSGFDPYLIERQQKEAAEKAKLETLRKKRHDEVNPVDKTQIFDARRKKERQEIEQIRQELKFLNKDVAKLYKEIDITLMGAVSDPGLEGIGIRSYYHQLRAFILLLRQQVKSATSWATQIQSKNNKKARRKGAAGIAVEGRNHEQTKSVYDMMHHERSNAYSGG